MADAGKRSAEEDRGGEFKRARGGAGDSLHVDLRILLQSKNAGAIIGKGGANIKRLRTDYKAAVTVPDSQGPERILTISSDLNTACDVLLDIIPTLEEYQHYNNLEFKCDIRMLVHQSQAGGIIGRAGYKIKELREKTGANIKVYSECCPHSTDRCTQMMGKPHVVIDCIKQIHDVLHQAPPKGPNQPYNPDDFDEYFCHEYGGFTFEEGMRGGKGGRGARGGGGRGRGGNFGSMGGRGGGGMRGSRAGRSGDFGRQGGMNGSGFGGGRSMGRGRGFGGGGGGGGGGGSGYRGGMGDMGMQSNQIGGFQGQMFDNSGSMGESKTQVTIPKEYAGAIIGKGGQRIRQIRNESQANIEIAEALPGSSDRIITITGSQESIQNAQYMLQMSVKNHLSGGGRDDYY